MASSELQKKTLVFFVLIGIITVILILLPDEPTVRGYMVARLGLIETTKGVFETVNGEKPMMAITMVDLAITVFNILKVILMMTLVVTIVRFIFYIGTKAVYRNAAPGEASTLLQTVISVIIYIVAFFLIFQNVFRNNSIKLLKNTSINFNSFFDLQISNFLPMQHLC